MSDDAGFFRQRAAYGVKDKAGNLLLHSIADTKGAAQEKAKSHWGWTRTWKAMYRAGYRVVDVSLLPQVVKNAAA